MRIYLGGHLNFYHPEKEKWLDVSLDETIQLTQLLDELKIPIGDIYLVVVNNDIEELEKVIVSDVDEVKIFPPVGGG